MPRVAEGPVNFQIIDKYERRRRDVDAAIGRLFLQGVSTRRLKGIVRELFGQEVSAATVSKTAGYLDEEMSYYQARPLTDVFPFLFFDGITQKVREIGVEKKVMCSAPWACRRMAARRCSLSGWSTRRMQIAGAAS